MLGGYPQIFGIHPNVGNDATPQHSPGTLGVGLDGRMFRYVDAGASDITVGNMQLAPAQDTALHDLVVNTALSQDLSLDITPGSTTALANALVGGIVVVNDDTGVGFNYRIKSHPAIASTTEFTLQLFDPIQTAFAAATTVTLVHNNWHGVVEGTSVTQPGAGVAQDSLTTLLFGWVCSKGHSSCLADTTITVGDEVVAGSSTAGALDSASDTAGTNVAQYKLGRAIVAGVDGERRPIDVMID